MPRSQWKEIRPSLDAVQKLIDSVQEHISDNVLNNHQGNTLIAKLQAALDQLNANAPESAAVQFNSFFISVDVYVRGHIMTPEQGQELSLSVQRIQEASRATEKKSPARSETEGSYEIDARQP